MKKIIAIFAFSSQAAIAQTLYVPTVHILNVRGEYTSNPIEGFQNGISLTECRMRIEVWEKRFAAAMAIAEKTLEERGQFSSMETSCEPKE